MPAMASFALDLISIELYVRLEVAEFIPSRND